eukprot:TRINITY_DN6981_c0_g1_i1.p1 TRINITY_DN6981_c0_g1~~TRINITY_DN6981_c0_g1_i1.p1  ORF type:complete len:377 (-),score=-6.69 TRINITY_DN6981_c0_g1_i1:575-1570(-)
MSSFVLRQCVRFKSPVVACFASTGPFVGRILQSPFGFADVRITARFLSEEASRRITSVAPNLSGDELRMPPSPGSPSGATQARDSENPSLDSRSESHFEPKYRAGDWQCAEPSCNYVNYKFRRTCLRCNAPAPAGHSSAEAPAKPFLRGDWRCSSCNTHNYASRSTCISCRQRAPAESERQSSSPDDSEQQPRQEKPFMTGDWLCPLCKEHNYASRSICKNCRRPAQQNPLLAGLAVRVAFRAEVSGRRLAVCRTILQLRELQVSPHVSPLQRPSPGWPQLCRSPGKAVPPRRLAVLIVQYAQLCLAFHLHQLPSTGPSGIGATVFFARRL